MPPKWELNKVSGWKWMEEKDRKSAPQLSRRGKNEGGTTQPSQTTFLKKSHAKKS